MGSIALPALDLKPMQQPDLMEKFGQLQQLRNAQQQGQMQQQQAQMQQQEAPLRMQQLQQGVQSGGIELQQKQIALKDQQAMSGQRISTTALSAAYPTTL